MSIGVEKVNGGVIGGQWTEGRLEFFKVSSAGNNAFDGSYALTPTEKGPRPAPDSAAEAVYRILSTRGTPVILEIVNRNEIHVALAYGVGDDIAAELQAAIRALGDDFSVKRFENANDVTGNSDDLEDVDVDFTDATVEKVDFELA